MGQTEKLTVILEITLEQVKKTQQKLSQMQKVLKGFKQAVSNIFGKSSVSMLSFLFAAQMVVRVLSRVATTGITTFQQVMSSVEGAATALTILNGYFDYLKFTVGSALNAAIEPFLATFTEWILKVSEWINQHKKLTGWLIIIGIVLGIIVTVVVSILLVIASMVAIFGTAATLVIAKVALIVGLFIAGIILVWFFLKGVWNNVKLLFGVIKPYLQSFWDWIKEKSKALWDWIKEKVKSLWEWIKTNIIDPMVERIEWVIEKIKSGIEFLKKFLGLSSDSAGSAASSVSGGGGSSSNSTTNNTASVVVNVNNSAADEGGGVVRAIKRYMGTA
jgi:hypothetical protein